MIDDWPVAEFVGLRIELFAVEGSAGDKESLTGKVDTIHGSGRFAPNQFLGEFCAALSIPFQRFARIADHLGVHCDLDHSIGAIHRLWIFFDEVFELL